MKMSRKIVDFNCFSRLIVLLSLLALGGCAANNRPMQLASGAGPVYPLAAKAAGIEGLVVVRYDVSQDGRVINARVDESSPEGMFEAAALDAVRSWRYNPAVKDGQAVGVENVVSRVVFKLEGASAYEKY